MSHGMRGTICGLVVLVALVFAVTADIPKHFVNLEHPVVLAHRGSRVIAPENTLLAFDTALAFGAEVIELDVYRTKDGQLAVYHDPWVNRTTGTVGYVPNFTLAELRALDAAYSFSADDGSTYPYRSKGMRIPTLDEVLSAFPDAYVNIEIKLDDKPTVHLLAETLLKHSRVERPIHSRVLVGGRFCDAIRLFRQLVPGMPTSACETEGTVFVIAALLRLPKLWNYLLPGPLPEAFQLPREISGLELGSPLFINAAHALNRKIHFFVVNNASIMASLLRMGADGLITDRVDLAVPVVAAHRSLPMPAVPHHSFAADSSREMPAWLGNAAVPRYVVPTHAPDDSHTCISTVCWIVQSCVQQPATIGIGALLSLFVIRKYWLLMRRVCRKRTAASTEGRGVPPGRGLADIGTSQRGGAARNMRKEGAALRPVAAAAASAADRKRQ